MFNNRISRNETAKILGVCHKTIGNFVEAKLLPEPVRIGRRQWFEKEEIERIAKEGTRKLQA